MHCLNQGCKTFNALVPTVCVLYTTNYYASFSMCPRMKPGSHQLPFACYASKR